MLIKELCDYYDELEKNKKIIPEWFSEVGIYYCVCLNVQGEITNIIPCYDKQEKPGSKQEINVPREMKFPKRTEKSAINSNIIEQRFCYLFGLELNKHILTYTEKTTLKKQIDFKNKTIDFLKDLHSPLIDAFRLFVKKWNPINELENEFLTKLEFDSPDCCFCLDSNINMYLQDDPVICKKWLEEYDKSIERANKGEKNYCPISGKFEPTSQTHSKIKKVPGGNTTGNLLVSFNNESEESYGNVGEQSINSGISINTMQKYTTALNYLLKNKENHDLINNIVIIHWALSPNEEEFMNTFLFDNQDVNTSEDINNEVISILNQIQRGIKPDYIGMGLDEKIKYYICGLVPNGARISIKFFYVNTFGKIMANFMKYYKEMRVSKNMNKLSFWIIANELLSKKSSNSSLPPDLYSNYLFSIIFGNAYPKYLLSMVIQRIQVDQNTDKNKKIKFNDIRIGIIKSYLMRNFKKENLKMSLEINNHDTPYLLGRLFAVLEKIQNDASNGGLNKTITNSYFASACSTPSLVFPRLLVLSQNHLAKLENPIYYNKLIGSIIANLPCSFPNTQSLEEQGEFIIGYYQEKNNLWSKKEDQIKEIE